MKLNRLLLNQAAGQGAADQGGELGAGHEAFTDPQGGQPDGGEPQPGQQQDPPEGGQGQQQQPPVQHALTADEIAEAIKKSGIIPPQQQQQQRQYTPEELSQRLNVYRVGDNVLRAIIPNFDQATPEQRQATAEALNELVTGAVKQAVTMASYQLQAMQEDHIAPLHQFMRQQTEQALRNEFYSLNQDLVGFEAIVDAVVGKMKQTGYNGEKSEGMKFVAEQARAIIKKATGGQAQNPNGQNQPRQQARPSKMSTLTGGGQGGAGDRSGSRGGQKSAGHSVFS